MSNPGLLLPFDDTDHLYKSVQSHTHKRLLSPFLTPILRHTNFVMEDTIPKWQPAIRGHGGENSCYVTTSHGDVLYYCSLLLSLTADPSDDHHDTVTAMLAEISIYMGDHLLETVTGSDIRLHRQMHGEAYTNKNWIILPFCFNMVGLPIVENTTIRFDLRIATLPEYRLITGVAGSPPRNIKKCQLVLTCARLTEDERIQTQVRMRRFPLCRLGERMKHTVESSNTSHVVRLSMPSSGTVSHFLVTLPHSMLPTEVKMYMNGQLRQYPRHGSFYASVMPHYYSNKMSGVMDKTVLLISFALNIDSNQPTGQASAASLGNAELHLTLPAHGSAVEVEIKAMERIIVQLSALGLSLACL